MNVHIVTATDPTKLLAQLEPDTTFVKLCEALSLTDCCLGPYWLLRDGTVINLTSLAVEKLPPQSLVIEVEGGIRVHVPRWLDLLPSAPFTPAAPDSSGGLSTAGTPSSTPDGPVADAPAAADLGEQHHAAGDPSPAGDQPPRVSTLPTAPSPGARQPEAAGPFAPLHPTPKAREQAEAIRLAYERLTARAVDGVVEGIGEEFATLLGVHANGWYRLVRGLQDRGVVTVEAIDRPRGGKPARFRVCLLPPASTVDEKQETTPSAPLLVPPARPATEADEAPEPAPALYARETRVVRELLKQRGGVVSMRPAAWCEYFGRVTGARKVLEAIAEAEGLKLHALGGEFRVTA